MAAESPAPFEPSSSVAHSIRATESAILRAIALGIEISGKSGTTILVGDDEDCELKPILSAQWHLRLALSRILNQAHPAALQFLPSELRDDPDADPFDEFLHRPHMPRLLELSPDAGRLFVLAAGVLPGALDLRRYGLLIRDFIAADLPVFFIANNPGHAAAVRHWAAAHGLRLATVRTEPSLDGAELLSVRSFLPSLPPHESYWIENCLEQDYDEDQQYHRYLTYLCMPSSWTSPSTQNFAFLRGDLRLCLDDRRVWFRDFRPISTPMPPDLVFALPGQGSSIPERLSWLDAVDQWLDDHLLEEAVDGR